MRLFISLGASGVAGRAEGAPPCIGIEAPSAQALFNSISLKWLCKLIFDFRLI